MEKGEYGVVRSGKTWLVDVAFPSDYLEVLNIWLRESILATYYWNEIDCPSLNKWWLCSGERQQYNTSDDRPAGRMMCPSADSEYIT